MDEVLQLYSFLFSFGYGLMFGIFSRWHFQLIEKYHKLWQAILTFVFIIDIVLGYLVSMYFLNGGVFHLYFLFCLFGGFWFSKYVWSFLKAKGIKIARKILRK